MADWQIEVPRARAGEFDPQFIRKGQQRFGGLIKRLSPCRRGLKI
jgi:transposase-like protein